MQPDPQWQAIAEHVAAHVARRLAEAPAPPASPWLTPAQAATYLGLSVPGLEQMRRAGEGPAFSKVQRVVRYHVRDLDAWLARGRTEGRE